ncbi:MAG: hypothetical protein RLZZ387_1861 [Chloroflexota bacterium]|jgi:hypothetical protein
MTKQRAALTMDHLLVATLLALVWLFISILPLPPNDLWWHMAAGRAMLQEGAWITTNRWAYTLPADAPYVYQSWLSEVLMYLAWQVAGTPGLMLLRTLCVTLGHALLAWHAMRRTGGAGKAVALALLLTVLAGWDNWTLRPQTLALVPGAVLVVVLGEILDGRFGRRWLAALPLTMLVWVNLHGSFILGLALIGLAWLGVVAGGWSSVAGGSSSAPGPRPSALGPLSLALRLSLARDFTLAAAVSALAVCIHPLGLGIFGYVADMLGNAELQERFVEWQPPRNAPDPLNTGFWFYLVLFLLAALMAGGRRRPGAVEVLWFCGLGWLAVDAGRYVIWFALALAPLLAAQFGALLPARAPAAPRPIAIGYGIALLALLVATLPWFEPGRALAPDGELRIAAASGPYRTLLSSTTPVGAAEWLAANPQPGRFWADMSLTSYTIWRLPELQVFADLRVELFPRAVWDEYFAIARGDQASLALIERWGITHLLLDRGYNQPLIELLADTSGWCERYADRTSVVYARCNTTR